MANRHLARSIVLQTLFEWDFAGMPEGEVETILKRNIAELAPGMNDKGFLEPLLDGVLSKCSVLNNLIEKAAPDWPIDKISIIDRNILRIGLYELLFSDRKEVPAKVAIDEAIELSKTFGGENSSKFVNGVLGSIYKEIGEPGKDETSQRKKKPAEVPYEKMPIQRMGGAVVFARSGEEIYLALVHDVFGHWTLSKGKLSADEDLKKGTAKKIKEEIGLAIKIKEELGSNEYIASHPEDGKIRKQVNYFLAEAPFEDLKLKKESGGLDDVKWFKLKDIIDLNFYDDILPIVTKAVNILLSSSSNSSKKNK